VIAASEDAERLGIHPGLPLAEAQALAGRTQCQWVPDDPAANREHLRALALRCQRFTPLAGLEDAERPECLLLEIGGSTALFGGEAALIGKLQRAFCRYDAQIGIADTIGAAWALTHHASPGSPGIAIPGSLPGALTALSIKSLRLSADATGALAALGLHTIDQLLELPRAELPSRFGNEVLLRLDQALGTREELIMPERLQEPLRAEWNGEDPLHNQAALEYLFGQLWSQLEPQLARHQAGVRELRCLALPLANPRKPRDSHPWVSSSVGHVQSAGRDPGIGAPILMGRPGLPGDFITLRLVQPTREARRLRELFRLQCERMTEPETSNRRLSLCERTFFRGAKDDITGLRLEVTWAEPLSERQTALFEGAHEERQRSLGPLVERLSSRLGEDAVLWLEPQADAQPECAYRFVPVLSRSVRVPRSPRVATRGLLKDDARPWHLHPQPRRVEVIAVVPDGPPQRVFDGGPPRIVMRVWGPERVETGWWRGLDVKRDYYRVEFDDGTHHWLFRERDSGHWFVHGVFA